jgi:hypothetical protein
MNLHETLAFAQRMHDGVDDLAGLPYITHPIWVMLHLPATCTDEDRQIALCHDVFEDCKARLYDTFGLPNLQNIDDLFTAFSGLGYSSYVVTGVRLLTRDAWPHLDYHGCTRNIIDSQHHGGMWVKYVDNLHNTDAHRISLLSPTDRVRWQRLQPRYERTSRCCERH